MNAAVLLLLFFQNADYAPAIKATADAQKREIQLREVGAASSRPTPSIAEENRKQYAAAREQEFVEKFNRLISNLMDFADTYRSGHAMDVKKAQAIRKAWLDLEKSEAIFQDDKKK